MGATTDLDIQAKPAAHRHFVESGKRPSPETIADQVDSDIERVLEADSFG